MSCRCWSGSGPPPRIAAAANPKSSTGRLDIFTRLITDRGRAFDEVPAGYQGQLYAEIVPRTFSVIVRQGTRLSQIRFRRGSPGSGRISGAFRSSIAWWTTRMR